LSRPIDRWCLPNSACTGHSHDCLYCLLFQFILNNHFAHHLRGSCSSLFTLACGLFGYLAPGVNGFNTLYRFTLLVPCSLIRGTSCVGYAVGTRSGDTIKQVSACGYSETRGLCIKLREQLQLQDKRASYYDLSSSSFPL